MHPVIIALLTLAGIIWWLYTIHLVNEEIGKLRTLGDDRTKRSPYSVGLKVPDWRILRTMAQQRLWVAAGLILAPVLVVTWGFVLILGLVFILLPMFAWETIENIAWTLKHSSRRG